MPPRCMTKARASPCGRRAGTFSSPAHMPSSKTVRESQHETSELMMPEHANNLGHVFGGVILSMMDKTGGDRRVSAQPRERRHGVDRPRRLSRADSSRRSGRHESEHQLRRPHVDGSRRPR